MGTQIDKRKNFSSISTPVKQVTKSVFRSETITCDIISIDNESSLDWVLTVVNLTIYAMISSPQPGVINNDISHIDLNHIFSSQVSIITISSSDSSEDITEYAWILRISSISRSPNTKLKKCWSLDISSL